jgi:multidrug efflux pump
VPNFSSIHIKFNYDITPTEALRKVKDAVDKARGDANFPTDLPAEPNVFEMNFSELMPVMNINLSGDYPMEQLHEYAKHLEDRIEDLTEINKVEIRGVPEREVKVSVDLYQLEALQLNFDDIANALAQREPHHERRRHLTGDQRRSVRVIGEFKDMEQIRNIVVKNEGQREVRLRDIADVDFGFKEPESFAREFGKSVVMLDVIKRAGENLLDASDKINAIIKEDHGTVLPADLTITLTGDQSDQTRVSVDELMNHIVLGVILVVGVLMLFLGLRNAVFVGLAIPMSMFISFTLLNAFGVTLNMMVLFALILALGRLVDDGIVIVENIHRHMTNGEPAMKATRLAVGEVTMPIIAATTATVMVFVPLLFWPGMMGEFMKYLPITFMIALGSSLFVALVVNPALASKFMKVEEERLPVKRMWRLSIILVVVGAIIGAIGGSIASPGIFGIGMLTIFLGTMVVANEKLFAPAANWFQFNWLPRLEARYEGFLRYALDKHHPRTFLLGTFGLLLFSFVLLGVFPPKTLFFPANEPQFINAFIEAPIGTDILKTDSITRVVERQVMKVIDVPDYKEVREIKDANGNVIGTDTVNFLVKSVIAQVGRAPATRAGDVELSATPHKGRIQVTFVKFADRKGINTNDVLARLQEGVTGYPGVVTTVVKNADGPPVGKPINIEIRGKEIEGLLDEAEKVKAFIEGQNVPGVEALRIDIDRAKPEMPIVIDREKARRLNVSTYAVADAIRTALFGKEVSTFRIEGDDDDYEINVRLKDAYRYDVQQLMDMRITFRDMLTGQIRQVPISAVAKEEYGTTFSAIKRKDLDRVVTVSSNVIAGYNNNEVVQADQGRDGQRLQQRCSLQLAFHRRTGGPGEGHGLPDDGFPCGHLRGVPHHRGAVQQHQLPAHRDEHRALQHHRRVPRPGGVPHGLRDHDDHARHHLPDRCGGEQRHRVDGLRTPALSTRTTPTGHRRGPHHTHPRKPRGLGGGGPHASATGASHRGHRRARPVTVGHRAQLQLLHTLQRIGPAHPHGRRQRGVLGTAELGGDLRPHLRHLPHSDPGAGDVADRDEDQACALLSMWINSTAATW